LNGIAVDVAHVDKERVLSVREEIHLPAVVAADYGSPQCIASMNTIPKPSCRDVEMNTFEIPI
jgi:hypothetical protein